VRLELPRVEAEGVDDFDFFYVTCPSCGRLTAVSRYTKDGDMAECDLPCLGQFWFYAGAFASARRSE
jgi:hypothetical protein